MSSAVADLETNLQAMLSLKPPGVSGSKISTVTSLCIANVQSESVLIQKIFTHFKKAPGTHKLGVLYVVDSVTRKWLEQAKQQGQPVSSSAPDGTFAAGVNRVTELMPVLMNDIVSSAPQDQKEKIRKLVDIWEKGQTFPADMIEGFKDKLNNHQSTTPPGSPPGNTIGTLNNRPNPAPPAVPANIMETLANIARQNANNVSSAPPVAQARTLAPVSTPYAASGPPSNPTAPLSYLNTTQPGIPFMPTSQSVVPPVNPPTLPFITPQPQPTALPNYGAQNGVAGLLNGMPGVAPSVPATGTDPTALQVALIQQLIQKGLPADQIAAVVKALAGTNAAAPAAAPPVPQPNQGYPLPTNGNGGWAPPRSDDPHDTRSPTNRNHGRSRSRSPGRHWDARDSPRGREDRRFGDYGRNSPNRDRYDDRDRSRAYRQRSPPGRHGQSPRHEEMPPFQQQKWIGHEPNLPSNHIKVLSRTLFVGGVNCSENELRNIFNAFGTVQTCIVNKEKRHAFVKMYSRKDAVSAKEAMEEGRSPDAQLRTRWGVGFGPRDCSDYQTGISVIPIHKLTEADRKWMLTAPYGGSGGKPITHGMVVEEPDIEIGAGVSSKAISRRMQTDKGGSHGPKSSLRDGGSEERNDRSDRGRHGRRGGRGDHRHRDEDRSQINSTNPNIEPVVPGFPYGINMDQNGMPVFPAGFVFPAPGDATTNPPY
ncbi:hypothetical protein VPNG_08755 [Cytospora leucostoma]|uniref:CID domain-containing protein n=1 Tax=Cytospora leucostoma TaxID=1230097 RepID=A0A423VXI2_9PEZI|nr:hypothetical protein VPNG_08755 [Cytospora leucostoma]